MPDFRQINLRHQSYLISPRRPFRHAGSLASSSHAGGGWLAAKIQDNRPAMAIGRCRWVPVSPSQHGRACVDEASFQRLPRPFFSPTSSSKSQVEHEKVPAVAVDTNRVGRVDADRTQDRAGQARARRAATVVPPAAR